jgi:hypothetical protein
VAVEFVPTWNSDGLISDGEIANFSGKQLYQCHFTDHKKYILPSLCTDFICGSQVRTVRGIKSVSMTWPWTVACKLVQSHLVKPQVSVKCSQTQLIIFVLLRGFST